MCDKPGALSTIIRFAFWLLYNPLAWLYDPISWVVSMGRWRDWQRAAIGELRGERVLDLACGTGNLLLDLSAAGYHPVGLDLSPFMIRLARRKLLRNDIAVPLLRGHARQLPFADAAFDSVVCTFPANFVMLDELARVLRPGGRAVIVPMAQLPTDNVWGRLLELLYRLTGQRSPLPNLNALLGERGFKWQTFWKDIDKTRVLLIVAERETSVN